MTDLASTIARWIGKTSVSFLGFATAMALGPGMLLLTYSYDLHAPLPDMLSDLPREEGAANMAFRDRAGLAFGDGSAVTSMVAELEQAGFTVSREENRALYTRRQGSCMENYGLRWRARDARVTEIATIVETRCGRGL